MATWMVHLRVAEQMLEVFPRLERQEFIVGNIAPDSGVPNEDWSVFTPDTNTSHFKTDGEIDIPKFLNKYMTGEKWAAYGEKAKSFFLGYYVHLLTDELWRDEVVYPTIEKHRELYDRDRMEAIWTFKKDWYDLDHLFIRNHPDFQPFLEYENAVGFQNCFMEEFAGDAFDRRRIYITGFYREPHEDLDREYPYLCEGDMQVFVAKVRRVLTERITRENWLETETAG